MTPPMTKVTRSGAGSLRKTAQQRGMHRPLLQCSLNHRSPELPPVSLARSTGTHRIPPAGEGSEHPFLRSRALSPVGRWTSSGKPLSTNLFQRTSFNEPLSTNLFQQTSSTTKKRTQQARFHFVPCRSAFRILKTVPSLISPVLSGAPSVLNRISCHELHQN